MGNGGINAGQFFPQVGAGPNFNKRNQSNVNSSGASGSQDNPVFQSGQLLTGIANRALAGVNDLESVVTQLVGLNRVFVVQTAEQATQAFAAGARAVQIGRSKLTKQIVMGRGDQTLYIVEDIPGAAATSILNQAIVQSGGGTKEVIFVDDIIPLRYTRNGEFSFIRVKGEVAKSIVRGCGGGGVTLEMSGGAPSAALIKAPAGTSAAVYDLTLTFGVSGATVFSTEFMVGIQPDNTTPLELTVIEGSVLTNVPTAWTDKISSTFINVSASMVDVLPNWRFQKSQDVTINWDSTFTTGFAAVVGALKLDVSTRDNNHDNVEFNWTLTANAIASSAPAIACLTLGSPQEEQGSCSQIRFKQESPGALVAALTLALALDSAGLTESYFEVDYDDNPGNHSATGTIAGVLSAEFNNFQIAALTAGTVERIVYAGVDDGDGSALEAISLGSLGFVGVEARSTLSVTRVLTIEADTIEEIKIDNNGAAGGGGGQIDITVAAAVAPTIDAGSILVNELSIITLGASGQGAVLQAEDGTITLSAGLTMSTTYGRIAGTGNYVTDAGSTHNVATSVKNSGAGADAGAGTLGLNNAVVDDNPSAIGVTFYFGY